MGPLKRELLDIYLITFWESVILEMQNLSASSFVSEWSKFKLELKNEEKTSEKDFCFWDNCISTGIVKLTLLRTRYLSLAANMLANSPKIWHLNKRYFFQLNILAVINKYDKGAVVQISTVSHVACQ